MQKTARPPPKGVRPMSIYQVLQLALSLAKLVYGVIKDKSRPH